MGKMQQQKLGFDAILLPRYQIADLLGYVAVFYTSRLTFNCGIGKEFLLLNIYFGPY